MKKVLIISFVFPPQHGVGGRRWAKFTRVLHEKGYDIQVICSSRYSSKESAWTRDVGSYSDKIERVDFNYPPILSGEVNSLFDRLNYRLQLFKNKRRIKGNYYDRTGRESRQFIEKVRQYLKDGYNNVIVSAGPFNYLNQILQLKRDFPDVNLIADFRDPWTNNEMAFGFSDLSAERLEIERQKEREVLLGYNHIVSVSEEMNNYFINVIGESDKFKAIPNGFDPMDKLSEEKIDSKNDLRFVLSGTFYKKAIHVFKEFISELQKAKEVYPELHKASFEFFGDVDEEVKDLAKDESNVFFQNAVSMQIAHEKIANSNGGLLFLTDDLTYSFSTKFYEYLLYNKKVLVFSKEGKTGNYVYDKGIGYRFFLGRMKEGFDSLIKDYRENNLSFPESFDLKSESIYQRVAEFEKLLT